MEEETGARGGPETEKGVEETKRQRGEEPSKKENDDDDDDDDADLERNKKPKVEQPKVAATVGPTLRKQHQQQQKQKQQQNGRGLFCDREFASQAVWLEDEDIIMSSDMQIRYEALHKGDMRFVVATASIWPRLPKSAPNTLVASTKFLSTNTARFV